MSKTNNTKSKQFDNSEIYRHLRTNIEFSSFEDDVKIINVTSTTPGEGKSTVAENLAKVFADKYEKVLLIDCDLRKSIQHRKFNITNKIGLSNLMKEKNVKIEIQGNYFKKIENKNLYILTSGSKVPNPAELLSSKRFSDLIEQVREIFDYIIIDCPPINAVTDAIPVSNVCDGTIFVVSSRETNKNEAKDALKQLQRNGVKVIGTVLTKVEDVARRYDFYYNDGE